jgi:hypothetical protein
MNIHCPVAADSGLGCLQLSSTLSRSILVDSCWQTEFPVARQGGGGRCPGWRGTGPCSIWARQVIALQHTGFNCAAHRTQLHILIIQMGPPTSDFSSVYIGLTSKVLAYNVGVCVELLPFRVMYTSIHCPSIPKLQALTLLASTQSNTRIELLIPGALHLFS